MSALVVVGGLSLCSLPKVVPRALFIQALQKKKSTTFSLVYATPGEDTTDSETDNEDVDLQQRDDDCSEAQQQQKATRGCYKAWLPGT